MPCSIASTSREEGARSSSAQQHCRPRPGSWAQARTRTTFASAWISLLSEKERVARWCRVSIQKGEQLSKTALQGGEAGGGVSLASVSSRSGAQFIFPLCTVARPERAGRPRSRQLALICCLDPSSLRARCLRIPKESVAGLADAGNRSG